MVKGERYGFFDARKQGELRDSQLLIYNFYCYNHNMLKVTDALREIIEGEPLLQFGLQHGLLNLSQVANYIRPHIQVRTKKPLTSSAIVMALSRMQNDIRRTTPQRDEYYINQIAIQANLCTYTFNKTKDVHRGVQKLYELVQKKNGYMTLSEGVSEITLIIDRKFQSDAIALIDDKPTFSHDTVASVGIMFDEKFTREVPGFIYIILQQLMLQGINLIELSSTFTGLNLYLDEKDTKLAFETLYALFKRRESLSKAL